MISSTANSEAFSDKSSMKLFNVSSEYMDVNVTSISDPVLWNCRRFSKTNDYYKFLYWMIIIAMAVIIIGFSITKFFALITASRSSGTECCSCKRGLTKLWRIAILQ